MLTINNKELRNLEEQVLKNKQDIAKHYEIDRTLANFGIKIVGTVATVNDLPDPLTYEGEYGDGYAVGQSGSYTYYIFTRPDLNQGIDTNYWLDVGQLAIQGPQGPVGPQGPQGPRGEATRWYTSSTELANANPGDLWLDKHGWVSKKSKENVWTSVTNIQGPQGVQGIRGPQGPQGEIGPQGPKGDTGEAGKFVTIAGILNSSSQLPRPSQIKNLSLAYLVGTSEPYKLWIQIGDEVETAVWEPMGPFNVATAVTVGGQYRSTWNADTKLDLIEPSAISTQFVLVVKDQNGYYQRQATGTFTPRTSYEDLMPVLRGKQGQIRAQVPTSPNDLDLVNIEYLRDNTKWYDHYVQLQTSAVGTVRIRLQKPYAYKVTAERQIPKGTYITDYGWITKNNNGNWSYNIGNGSDTGGNMTITVIDDEVSQVI